jgi:hypothetical protein
MIEVRPGYDMLDMVGPGKDTLGQLSGMSV